MERSQFASTAGQAPSIDVSAVQGVFQGSFLGPFIVTVMTSLESGLPVKRRCLNLIVNMLYFCGFWPTEDEETRNWSYYWRYFLPRITIIRTLYSIVFHIINVNIVWGDLPYMVEYMFMCLIYIHEAVDVGTMFYYRQDLKAMFDELDALHDPRMVFNEYTRKSLKRYERLTHWLTKKFFIVITIVVLSTHSLVVTEGYMKRKLPFRLWLPYEHLQSPVFEMSLLTITSLSIIDILILNVCFLTFIVPAMLTIGQLHLLSYKLKNIRHHVEKKLKKNEARGRLTTNSINPSLSLKVVVGDDDLHLRGITGYKNDIDHDFNQDNGDDVSDEVIDENIDTILRDFETLEAHDVTPCPGQTSAPRRVDWFPLAKTEEDVEMESYLRHCIKHHQKLLSITKTLGHVFKKILALNMLYSAMGGTVTLYVSSLGKSLDAKMLSVICVTIIFYAQVLCLCLVGGKVAEEAENARDAVYDCDWFGASESFKRSMRIMISRMNRPLLMKAAGLPLSVGTYRLMCRAVYYGHMVLSKLLRGEKIMKTTSL